MSKEKKYSKVERLSAVVELNKIAPDSEFSIDFLEKMLLHMGGSSLEKYGFISERYSGNEKALPHVSNRFTEYLYTRNKKYLVDAANFSMIEFMYPSLEEAYFEATDSDSSPGRIFDEGEQTNRRNSNKQQETTSRPVRTKIYIESNTPTTEYSVKFLQGMINRMAVSYAKYGALKDGYPLNVNCPESLRLRLDKYLKTANTEYLIDVANFCMIEYMHPALVKTHYNPISDLGKAGRLATTSAISLKIKK